MVGGCHSGNFCVCNLTFLFDQGKKEIPLYVIAERMFIMKKSTKMLLIGAGITALGFAAYSFFKESVSDTVESEDLDWVNATAEAAGQSKAGQEYYSYHSGLKRSE